MIDHTSSPTTAESTGEHYANATCNELVHKHYALRKDPNYIRQTRTKMNWIELVLHLMFALLALLRALGHGVHQSLNGEIAVRQIDEERHGDVNDTQ
jgi:hypothetical protein